MMQSPASPNFIPATRIAGVLRPQHSGCALGVAILLLRKHMQKTLQYIFHKTKIIKAIQINKFSIGNIYRLHTCSHSKARADNASHLFRLGDRGSSEWTEGLASTGNTIAAHEHPPEEGTRLDQTSNSSREVLHTQVAKSSSLPGRVGGSKILSQSTCEPTCCKSKRSQQEHVKIACPQ